MRIVRVKVYDRVVDVVVMVEVQIEVDSLK